jgi:hypothetical protein
MERYLSLLVPMYFYCNRTATGLEQSRTEQKNESTENVENRVDKANPRIQ